MAFECQGHTKHEWVRKTGWDKEKFSPWFSSRSPLFGKVLGQNRAYKIAMFFLASSDTLQFLRTRLFCSSSKTSFIKIYNVSGSSDTWLNKHITFVFKITTYCNVLQVCYLFILFWQTHIKLQWTLRLWCFERSYVTELLHLSFSFLVITHNKIFYVEITTTEMSFISQYKKRLLLAVTNDKLLKLQCCVPLFRNIYAVTVTLFNTCIF